MATVLDVWHGIAFCPDRSVELRIAFGPSMTALVYHLSRSFRLLDIKCNLPKNPDPSKMAILRTRTPAIQVQTLPLEGPRILRAVFSGQ